MSWQLLLSRWTFHSQDSQWRRYRTFLDMRFWLGTNEASRYTGQMSFWVRIHELLLWGVVQGSLQWRSRSGHRMWGCIFLWFRTVTLRSILVTLWSILAQIVTLSFSFNSIIYWTSSIMSSLVAMWNIQTLFASWKLCS